MGQRPVLRLEWGERAGQACLRVSRAGTNGPIDAEQLRVYPTDVAASGTAGLPPMTGRRGTDGNGAWFVPRFGFMPGTSYTVVCEGDAASLDRPAAPGEPTTTVLAIYPSTPALPRNHLRVYVHFSAPMSEGCALAHVHVRDAATREELAGALLETTEELWDRERRRLTLLFDPGRIKRGLVPQRQAGYPLVPGRPVELLVDAGFRDALGLPLAAGSVRTYDVGPDLRGHVDPASWALRPPEVGTRAPLVVDFDRPLDHGLLVHSLSVTGPDGARVPGVIGAGPEERSWAFAPARPWAPGAYRLDVDHRLEDVAGNSVARVFDRDLSDPCDNPRPEEPARLRFVIA